MAERGRPIKHASDRKTAAMKIPLTEEEKGKIMEAAQFGNAKPVTWAREVLLRAAKRKK
jgi:cell division inhibitor SulA